MCLIEIVSLVLIHYNLDSVTKYILFLTCVARAMWILLKHTCSCCPLFNLVETKRKGHNLLEWGAAVSVASSYPDTHVFLFGQMDGIVRYACVPWRSKGWISSCDLADIRIDSCILNTMYSLQIVWTKETWTCVLIQTGCVVVLFHHNLLEWDFMSENQHYQVPRVAIWRYVLAIIN